MSQFFRYISTCTFLISSTASLAMTPKYPYEPLVTSCLNEVVLAGEAFVSPSAQSPSLRLQADLTITPDTEASSCQSITQIKFVFLKFNNENLLSQFNEAVGTNILVSGEIQPDDAKSVKNVTFSVITISPIK